MAITIKICGLTRVDDVKASIDQGAEVLGFVFDRGPCSLNLIQVEHLLAPIARATSTHLAIAVVGDLSEEHMLNIVRLGFDGIQAVEPAYEKAVAANAPFVVPAFFDDTTLAIRVRAFRHHHAPAFDQRVGWLRGCVNVDGRGGGGTGTLADWRVAAELAAEGPLMLAGGLTAENVGAAIARVRPDVIDVSSGVEAAPGIKDHGRLQAFVAAARSAAKAM